MRCHDKKAKRKDGVVTKRMMGEGREKEKDAIGEKEHAAGKKRRLPRKGACGESARSPSGKKSL